ncbi:hypothetical protein [Vibrio sp. ER1A]|uniref:hypothetical protein n=1 Tax=Vibrio sp. ER1A TaxID=1517681 RepID=UPI0004DD28F0|nr:hypothetical protein [Vibrio sp. ER1A]KFA99266.1 hypothetical protein HW45_04805 [Vibrio sp. ER1A]
MAGLQDISVSNYMKLAMGATEITDIESFGGLNEETSIVEVKQYNQKFARKLSGSSTVGAVEITCSFNPASESYKALTTAKAADARNEFTVTYYNNASKSEASSRTFHGIVTSYSESGEYDAQRTCTWTIAVDGALGALTEVAAPSK